MVAAKDIRERILDQAEDRFLREGFVRVSVDDIATSLGMSKKTFYKVFKSKESLIEQLTYRVLGKVRIRVETIVNGRGTFIEKAEAMTTFLPGVSRIAESALVSDLQRHLPRVWRKVEDFRQRRIMENFTILIQQGIKEGDVRDDINVRLFVLALVSSVQSIIRPSVLADESFSAREALQGILRLFFWGVLTPEGREAFPSIPEAIRPRSF